MKNILKIFLLVITSFLCFNVFAESNSIKVTYDEVNIRSGPGSNHTYVGKAYTNDKFNLVDTKQYPNEKGCSGYWYRIYFGSGEAYICSDYAEKEVPIEDVPVDASCESAMSKEGFPKSYIPYLCSLKAKHPTWTFKADKNNQDFNTAVNKEAVGKKSLLQTSYEGYLSTDAESYNYLTDTFKVKEGSNWYSANPSTVAYYMDPRNFLDEKSIFMFEKLSFDDSYQTLDAISSVLAGRDIVAEKKTILNASKQYNVNAIYLASRIRQETGGNYSNYSLAGNSVTVSGVYYPHIYNPYNIGAYTGAQDGIVWAASGTSYLRPWTTIPIAIAGGASFISSGYIALGQDTVYFQKFNTSSYSGYSLYSHQYMSNIKAPSSEASISYNGYNSLGFLDNTAFKFVIPVYNNMSDNLYTLPNKGNPNNHLKALTVNNTSVNGFSHDKYSYTYYVADGINAVNIGASTINSKAKVSGNGNVNLTGNETNAKVVVTAENGNKQTYTIKLVKTSGVTLSASDIVSQTKLVKSDNYLIFGVGSSVESLNNEIKSISSNAKVTVANKTSGVLCTGDLVTITNGDSSISFNAVVKGDPTGDGNINIQDLLRIQKFILGYTDLSGSYLKACDNNADGVCNILDLLRTQKHILGYLTIN